MPYGLGSVKGRIAVVTGAASGIGRATAHLLARRGATLALGDIDAVGLERVLNEVRGLGARVHHEHVDVRRAGEVTAWASRVERALGTPDLLVNSAGIVVLAGFLETTLEDFRELIDVNLMGPVHVCRAFLPAMLARRAGGFVVNVASAAAFASPSELAGYGATKHGLLGLSQALSDELSAQAIGVSCVCPGFVDTPILTRARVRGAGNSEERRAAAARLLRWRRLSPERVAERIVRAAERGEPVVSVGMEAVLLSLLSRLSPRHVAPLFGRLRRLGSRT
jgi:NAD(P)-dependent dehydrogenase (short-subunit alcohol dehydrogenase family)